MSDVNKTLISRRDELGKKLLCYAISNNTKPSEALAALCYERGVWDLDAKYFIGDVKVFFEYVKTLVAQRECHPTSTSITNAVANVATGDFPIANFFVTYNAILTSVDELERRISWKSESAEGLVDMLMASFKDLWADGAENLDIDKIWKPNRRDDKLPEHIQNPPGRLKELVDYFMQSASSPVELFAIPTALSIMSTILGRFYKLDFGPQGSYSTLYYIMMADSNVGKNDVIGCINKVLEECGLTWLSPNGFPNSSSAYMSMLKDNPKGIVVEDEIQELFIQLTNDRTATNTSSAFKTAREAWSSCNRILAPRTLSDRGATKKEGKLDINADYFVMRPAVSIVGLAQPKKMRQAIKSSIIDDGTLGRFFTVITSQQAKGIEFIDEEGNKLYEQAVGLSSQMKLILSEYAKFGNSNVDLIYSEDNEPVIKQNNLEAADPVLIPIDTDAGLLLQGFSKEIVCRIGEMEMKGEPYEILGRAAETAIRIALCVAALDISDIPNVADPNNPPFRVKKKHAGWAIDFTRWHMLRFCQYVKEHMGASSEYGTNRQIMLDIIRKGTELGNGLSQKELLQATGFCKPVAEIRADDRRKILDDLETARLIYLMSPPRRAGQKGPNPKRWVAMEG